MEWVWRAVSVFVGIFIGILLTALGSGGREG